MMFQRSSLWMLGCGLWLWGVTPGLFAQPAAPPAQEPAQQGMEVLARGPVHEAYAEPVVRGPRPSPVVAKKPPEPVPEVPPDQKPAEANVQWIPGYWGWDDDRQDFLWVSGIWRVPPPGYQWVPGYWNQVEGGSQWVAGYWAPQDTQELQYLPQPPDPIEEAVSPAPNDTDVYVPGCWVNVEQRYHWRPGFWHALRQGWIWVNAGYVWTPAGCVFVEGHWDYPLEERGLLFCPVAFTRPLWTQPGWSYQPSYLVYQDYLQSALFVRPSRCHYYFGDYFGDDYRRTGFTPWTDYRIGQGFDPLLTYYRWHHRDNPRWFRDLHEGYVARGKGEMERPPRTLTQQHAMLDKIDKGTLKVTPVERQRLLGVASLKQVDKKVIKLQPLPKPAHDDVRKHAEQFHTLQQQRVQGESRIHTPKPEPSAPPARPSKVKLELPKPPPVRKQAPPAPKLPKPQPHPAGPPAPPAKPQPPVQIKPAPAPAKPAAPPAPAPKPAAPPAPAPKPAAPPAPAPKPAAPPAPHPTPKVEPAPHPAPPHPAPKPHEPRP